MCIAIERILMHLLRFKPDLPSVDDEALTNKEETAHV